MYYKTAKDCCHVRSAIYRTSNPNVKYWKNHTSPLDERVPDSDKVESDWKEYDPRECMDDGAMSVEPGATWEEK